MCRAINPAKPIHFSLNQKLACLSPASIAPSTMARVPSKPRCAVVALQLMAKCWAMRFTTSAVSTCCSLVSPVHTASPPRWRDKGPSGTGSSRVKMCCTKAIFKKCAKRRLPPAVALVRGPCDPLYFMILMLFEFGCHGAQVVQLR